MTTLRALVAVSFWLIACNQIAGIQKPNTGAANGGTGGGGDDTASDDDTTNTGNDTSAVASLCSPACTGGETCRYASTSKKWECETAGQGTSGDTCQYSTTCAVGFFCLTTFCAEYCNEIGADCSNGRACVGEEKAGACLDLCDPTSEGYCSPGNTCALFSGRYVCVPDELLKN